jgi:AhpD family alkylhydroperoxidase
MTPRLNPYKASPEAMKALVALENYVQGSGLDHSLIDLVKTRASQINGCAYCIHMHTSEARARGETEERLYLLDAWHESPLYSERERAALAWTEAVRLVSETHVPDAVYDQAPAFLRNGIGQPDTVRCCDQCLEPHCNQLPRGSSDTLEGRSLKLRPKGRVDGSAGRIPIEGDPGEKEARVRLGSYEFRKKGVSRFDLRDPYRLAVTLTWPQFLAALLTLYRAVNPL